MHMQRYDRIPIAFRDVNIPIFCTLEEPPYKQKIVGAFHKMMGLSPFAKDFIELAKEVVATCPALKASCNIEPESENN